MIKRLLIGLTLISLLCAFTVTQPQKDLTTVFLTTLTPKSTSVGFAHAGMGVNPFTEGSLVEGQTITVNGKQYPNGLFTHAPANLVYDLKGEYAKFSGSVMMHDGINCGDGVNFQIFTDGAEAFRSGTIVSGQEAVTFSIDVAEVKELGLVVDPLSDMDCDWAVWGDPILQKKVMNITETPQESSFMEISPFKGTTAPSELSTQSPELPKEPALATEPANNTGWLPEGAILRWGNGAFYDMAGAPDESTLAIAAEGGIYLIDTLTGQIKDFLSTVYTPWSIAYSPDGTRLYIGLGLGGTQIWQTADNGTWQFEKTLKEACGRFIKVSPDGNTLLSKCFSKKDNSFKAWDLSTGKQIFNLNYQIKITNVFAMDFSPVDPTRAAFARGNILALIDLKTGRDIKIFTEPNTNIITDIDFSPDGKTIAVSPNTREIIILDAETLEEKQRNTNPAEVRMLTFRSNEELVALTKDSYVLQNVDGKISRAKPFSGYPMHAYFPGLNFLALASSSVELVDLDNFQVENSFTGFDGSTWTSHELSADGQSFIYGHVYGKDWAYFSGSLKDPGVVNRIELNSFCQNAAAPRFADAEGDYIQIQCPDEKQLVIGNLRSMRVVSRNDLPLWTTTNYSYSQHPWKDDQPLSAMLYKTDGDKTNEYRVDIRDLVNDRFVSSITMENPAAGRPYITGFSPTSKYLVVLTSDKKKYLIFDTASGSLIQTINITLTDTRANDNPSFSFIKNETLFMIRKGKTVEVISTETGEPVMKYLSLKDENFAYIETMDRLVNYSYRWGQKKNALITMDVYTLESNKKEIAYTLDLPFNNDPAAGDQVPPYSCMLENKGNPYVFLKPDDSGLNAVIFMTCSSNNKPWDYENLKSFKNVIFITDVLKQEIKTQFEYYPDFTWFNHLYMFDDLLYTIDDGFIFVWDTSIKN